MEYKIEKGIPIKSNKKYPFSDMEVGDSFFAITHQATLSSYVSSYGIKNKKKFITRKENDGYRVWRIA